uniref:Uncharacterized protein n=1 Tax=Arion vulgaris TaxID=1028688 RepID=A0A0B6ZNR5_9EUPU
MNGADILDDTTSVACRGAMNRTDLMNALRKTGRKCDSYGDFDSASMSRMKKLEVKRIFNNTGGITK